MTRRGTSNANARGNSLDRLARKRYLIRAYEARDSGFHYVSGSLVRGPGYALPGLCRCYACAILLNLETVTVDRIVPGAKGGRYVRENIRPACSQCNSETGGALAHSAKRR